MMETSTNTGIPQVRRGIYLLPTIFTLANLAAGVTSILLTINDHLTSAAWAIMAGIVMDMLDGRVARWAKATSQFGLELDSLCDLVSFGLAPGILIYQLSLQPLGRPGYMIAIFFAMAAALRLARFNLKAQSSVEPSTHFVGLPVPAAAGILASFVLSYDLFDDADISVKTIPMLMHKMPVFFNALPIIMLGLSFLMISRVQYSHFKQLKLGRPKSIQSLSIIVGGLLLIFTYPQNTIFILFSMYVISGFVGWAWRLYQSGRERITPQNLRRRKTDRAPEQEVNG